MLEEVTAEQNFQEQMHEITQSQVEQGARTRQGNTEKEMTNRWKMASFFLAAIAIILLIGLATSLAVFLSKL